MVRTTEGWHAAADGTKLYTKSWHPDAEPVAHLAFVHGFSDHCNAYYELFPFLTTRGIQVSSFDQRGWGRSVHSPAEKGLTGPTSTVLADIRSFLHSISTDSKPLFLMGHSMGGAEALTLLLSRNETDYPKLSGLLLESPYFALDPASQPGAFTVFAGKMAARVMPKKQLLQKLDSTYMSRDAKVREDWVKDELCHDTGTLEGLAGMLQRAADCAALGLGKQVDNHDVKIGVPVWLGHGSKDGVTSFVDSERVFKVLDVEDKTFKNYEGAYHKLHAEPDGVGEEFAADVADWILARVGEGDVKAKL